MELELEEEIKILWDVFSFTLDKAKKIIVFNNKKHLICIKLDKGGLMLKKMG